MARITVARTNRSMPDAKALDGARDLLFGALRGATKEDESAWRRLWKRMTSFEAGEFVQIDVVQPRSGPFHRRHMAIEQAVFDAQERFSQFEQFRTWLKVGAGWVDWCAGPKGGVVPIPKSISYAKADEDEFHRYHDQVMQFLRGEHAANYLWPHIKGQQAADMMDAILQGFDE